LMLAGLSGVRPVGGSSRTGRRSAFRTRGRATRRSP
jgi:hypothetical protein